MEGWGLYTSTSETKVSFERGSMFTRGEFGGGKYGGVGKILLVGFKLFAVEEIHIFFVNF